MVYVLLLALLIPLVIVDVLNELKEKISKEFLQLLCQVRKGHKPNYETILEEISFVDIVNNKEIDDKLSLTALQYYLNGR